MGKQEYIDFLTRCLCLKDCCERRDAASDGNIGYKTKKAQTKGTLATSEQFRQRVKRKDGKQRNVTPL